MLEEQLFSADIFFCVSEKHRCILLGVTDHIGAQNRL